MRREGIAKNGIACKAERRDSHRQCFLLRGVGLVHHNVARAATDIHRHITAARHVGALIVECRCNGFGVAMQIFFGIAANVGVVEFFPRGGEATSVGAAHAHGVEIHHPHLMQISVFQECFRLDKHHDFA